MRSVRHVAILLLVGGCARAVPEQSPDAPPSDAAAVAALDPTRFEAEIRAFEAADRASPPPLGGVVFVGSSSIAEEIERVTHGASEEDLVNSGLEETKVGAYHPIREGWKQQQGKVDLRIAAMIVAIDKVALSYEQLGIFP